MRRPVLALLAAALLGGCGGEGIPRVVAVGEPVPEYGAVSLASDSVSLADLRGKVVLLNVWATWCPPCREEMPALQRLYERHRGEGLEVVGVSVDAAGEGPAVQQFVRDHDVTFPIWLDPQERVTSVFRTQGVPTTFLIDREGKLLWRHLGPVTEDDPELNRLLGEALRGAA